MTALEGAIALVSVLSAGLSSYLFIRPGPSVVRLVETGAFTEERARRVVHLRAWAGMAISGCLFLIVMVAQQSRG
jgi:hypothetical protein